MANMTTVLTEFADNGNSRTNTLPGHTALKPKLVIQKRIVAQSENQSPEDTIDVVFGTTDAEGSNLPSKVAFSVKVRRPYQGQATDVTNALAIFREIVASDNFAAVVTTQGWLQ